MLAQKGRYRARHRKISYRPRQEALDAFTRIKSSRGPGGSPQQFLRRARCFTKTANLGSPRKKSPTIAMNSSNSQTALARSPKEIRGSRFRVRCAKTWPGSSTQSMAMPRQSGRWRGKAIPRKRSGSASNTRRAAFFQRRDATVATP
jgi:hypothetical protein